MNCTSFTLNDTSSNNDKNIDTSSTAHLTLNAASGGNGSHVPGGGGGGGGGGGTGGIRGSFEPRGSNQSDSDLDGSPSVTVLTNSPGNGPSSNINLITKHHNHRNSHLHHTNHTNHHHNNHHPLHNLHHSIPRGASQLISGGLSFSSRLHSTTKHPRTLWSRSTQFEKVLLSILILLAIIGTIIITSLTSIIVKQKHQITILNATTTTTTTETNKELSSTSGSAIATKIVPPLEQQKPVNNIPGTQITTTTTTTRNLCLTPDCVKVAASVIEAIDLTVDPCDDFYMYSCGDWIKSNPLPDGKSNWGTFSKLWQDNQSIMRAVLEESANFVPGSAEEKAKIYYESCLDRNDTVELRGTKPMQDLIESAGGWNISGNFDVKTWDLQSSLQIYHNQYNRGGLFSWAVGADERNSTRNIIQLDQGGLGLPSRDYYLNKTDKNVLDAYFIYMVKVAELMGGVNVKEQMKEILEFEKKLAAITVPQDQRRDDERMYHKFTLRELAKRSPFLNWTKYFDDAFDYHSRTTISFSSEIRPKNDTVAQQTKDNTPASSSSSSSSDTNAKYTVADPSSTSTLAAKTTHAPAPATSTSTPSTATSSSATPTLVTSSSLTDNSGTSSSGGSSGSGSASTNSISGDQKQLASTISKHHITDDENIVIYSPEYFEELSLLVSQYTNSEKGKVTLANYMAWSVIQSLIATLPKNFRDASKVLRKALIGSEGIEVSWRYCVTDTNQVMGFALGSLFVRRVFQGKSKERAEEMIYSIRNAFKDNLPNLNWMDDRTRHLAREKADHINQMIGFPDFILSPEKLNGKYEGLELDENNFFENNIKVNVLQLRENMEKINKLANKTEWEMTPPMVNAYYTPTKNQIVFPAGILQTPFYDLSYPNSLNYGAMGVVMGHELTHAFDDQGREYDKDGNLYQWWYNETLKNFEERVKCFVDQYSTYKIDDNHLNGKQTLGENIADNGGLKAAFRAYEKWSEINREPQLPGLNLTGKQLFFVGFAQVWCSISTPEALKLQVLNDPHAPAQFRVIGTLSNSYEFAREFNCAPGTNMNPEKKCVVW